MIASVLLVGLTEEIVFRGWLLNASLNLMLPLPALLLNAVMFLGVHLPIWAASGPIVLTDCITILFLSFAFGYSFLKTKNIYIPMLLHMGYNFLVEFLF